MEGFIVSRTREFNPLFYVFCSKNNPLYHGLQLHAGRQFVSIMVQLSLGVAEQDARLSRKPGSGWLLYGPGRCCNRVCSFLSPT